MASTALNRRNLLLGAATAGVLPRRLAAQGNKPLRIAIGVALSGPYTDNAGPHQLVAVQMAIDDFGGTVLGRSIQLLSGDDQSKPDISSLLARQWFEQGGIDGYLASSTTASAYAVLDLAKQHNTPFMLVGPGTSEFVGKNCAAITTQWVWDSYSLSRSVVRALARRGLDSWFLVAVDTNFGISAENELRALLGEVGGRLVGSTRHALGTTDFSTYVLQAQASGAKVVAEATIGADLVNFMKQCQEFGITRGGQSMAALSMSISQVHALGLEAAQGIELTTPFYHDRTEATRAWTDRYLARDRGHVPNLVQAGAYSATLHYLKSVQAAGTADGAAVMAAMRAMPVNDFSMNDVRIRADGQVMRPMYFGRIKKPSESHYMYDYMEITDTIPAEQAWHTLEQGGCPLVARNG